MERRLARHGITAPIGDLIGVSALYALEAVCVERDGSVREVLRVAQDPCLLAAAESAMTFIAEHVFAAQAHRRAAGA